MNKQSIFFTLTIAFVISFLLVVASLFLLLKVTKEDKSDQIREKYFSIARVVHIQMIRGNIDEVVENVQNAGLKLIVDPNQIDKILSSKNMHLELQHRHNRLALGVFHKGDDRFIHIQTPGTQFLLIDKNSFKDIEYIIWAVFAIILLTLISSAIATFKKLYPLKTLKNQVKIFGDENFDALRYNSDKKDEVSQLAYEFTNSAKKLKNIKEARNVFIRNIMHELKTPITKGKFLLELPKTDQNQEKMRAVFYRMENLINEFAQIEQIISNSKQIEKKEYHLSDIIDNAIDLLMIDEEDVSVNIEDYKVYTDFKLFTIAVKNLIDNGIKYSPNNHIDIKIFNNEIHFISKGEALKKPLEQYCEPFVKGDDQNSSSFGLGLYIVQNILQEFGYKLDYQYLNGNNIFKMVKYPKI